jgi:hypothetical protein
MKRDGTGELAQVTSRSAPSCAGDKFGARIAVVHSLGRGSRRERDQETAKPEVDPIVRTTSAMAKLVSGRYRPTRSICHFGRPLQYAWMARNQKAIGRLRPCSEREG